MAKVPNHAHCQVCGRAIQPKESYCGSECQEEAEEQQAKNKRMLYTMYALFALGFIMLVVVPFFTQ